MLLLAQSTKGVRDSRGTLLDTPPRSAWVPRANDLGTPLPVGCSETMNDGVLT